MNKYRFQKGQAMLLTVMLMSTAVLGVTSVIGLVMIYEIRHTVDAISSTQAIYAADSGIECALYHNTKDNTVDCNAQPAFNNGASYLVEYDYGQTGLEVGARSYGKSRKVNRAFAVRFLTGV